MKARQPSPGPAQAWITKDIECAEYEIWTEKPEYDPERKYWSLKGKNSMVGGVAQSTVVCEEEFERLFPRLKMEGGPECIRKVSITIRISRGQDSD